MHSELLMHVAAAHIQDRVDYAARQRQAREARRSVETSAARSRIRLRWPLRRTPAQPVVPAR
jgi:hypothetical protein